jgi:Fur family peroxide stress response transcriptional regulator
MQRYSQKREDIKSTLMTNHGALSAAQIHATLPHIDLTTIYRNLEKFVEEGHVKKLILDGVEALYEYQTHPHHHAICDDCHKVIHFTAKDDRLKKLLQVEGFTIDTVEVTVHGTCEHTK